MTTIIKGGISKLQYYLIFASLVAVRIFSMARTVHAQTAQTTPGCIGDSPTAKHLCEIGQNAGFYESDIKMVIANLIRVVLGFVGIIFLVLIIWSGFEWMTSGGNEERIKNAKKRIMNATIGLVVVVMAYSIAYFITQSLEKAAGGGGGAGNIETGG